MCQFSGEKKEFLITRTCKQLSFDERLIIQNLLSDSNITLKTIACTLNRSPKAIRYEITHYLRIIIRANTPNKCGSQINVIAQGYVLTVYKVAASSVNMITAMIYVMILSLHRYASIHLISPMSAIVAQMSKSASCLKYSIRQTLPKNRGMTMSVVGRKAKRNQTQN